MIPISTLAADPRYRGLTLALRGALLDLLLAAAPDGSIPTCGTPAEAARALWGAEAPALLSGLTASGLVAQDGPSWALAFVSRPTTSPVPFSPPEHTPAPLLDLDPDGKAAARLRSDRHAFRKRLKGWSRVPPDVTWETWLSTDEGMDFADDREERFPGYVARSLGWGNGGVTPKGNAPVTVGGNGGVTLPVARASEIQNPPSFQASEKTKTQKEEPQTREGNAPVTVGGNGGGNANGVTPATLTVDDLDGPLTVQAAGRLDLRAPSARLKLTLLQMLRELGVTSADVPRLARAMDPAKLWPWAKLTPPVTVSWLLGKPGPSGEYDAARLQEWVTAARALPDPSRRPSRPPSAPEYRPETPEEAAARIAAFKDFRTTPKAA